MAEAPIGTTWPEYLKKKGSPKNLKELQEATNVEHDEALAEAETKVVKKAASKPAKAKE